MEFSPKPTSSLRPLPLGGTFLAATTTTVHAQKTWTGATDNLWTTAKSNSSKPMKMLGTCFALALFGLTPGFTQDDFDPLGELHQLPKIVRIQIEFIEVPQPTMTTLLYGPRKSADDTELRAKLREHLEVGKANETRRIFTLSGDGEGRLMEAGVVTFDIGKP